MHIIKIENVSHIYNNRKIFKKKSIENVALRNISLNISKGEIFGIVGPNGAGKTTLIKVICNLLIPTNGNVQINGLDINKSSKKIYSSIGLVLGGEKGLYYRLTGYENLLFFGYLYNLRGEKLKRRIDYVLNVTGLNGLHKNNVETYSRGMKQRLHIARALLHNPSILILDEPTIGLDPVSSKKIRQLIRGLSNEGKTIILTSHYMNEVEELCDRLAVINDGQIVRLGTPDNVKETNEDITKIVIEMTEDIKDEVRVIDSLPFVTFTQFVKDGNTKRLIVYSTTGTLGLAEILTQLKEIPIGKIEVKEPSLEDAYISLVATH